MKWLLLLLTHAGVGFAGFALGIYLLPILIAQAPPTDSEMSMASANSLFTSKFTRELEGSDFLHWGEGVISLKADKIVFQGELAPGPDYKLYLSPKYVETEEAFLRIKPQMVLVGDIKSFNGFLLDVPNHIDISAYSNVVVWCETFSEFITAAQYQ
ncbi:DM13 domain-containing protein [uncultured Neptuniibacter sp.]|uniref:DM13 domain-containing protein n=1 Tax=uncultured Neptuniibacter sp. TaxID=502143 RepID=UPI00260F4752|nr:DM13 domain-containing protein [uncultured Neptuniibacter sp.]